MARHSLLQDPWRILTCTVSRHLSPMRTVQQSSHAERHIVPGPAIISPLSYKYIYLQRRHPRPIPLLSVTLRHTLELILLLDGVRVGRTLGSVDKLIGQAFRDRLGVVEGGFACLQQESAKTLEHWKVVTHPDGEKRDGLVDTSKRGDIDSLSTNSSLGTDTGRVFSWSRVDNGVDYIRC